MKQIITLANSFVLQETDAGGNITFELGYQKGGLTYLIKNRSIKFYLVEDYFYKNVVWTANIPLVIDGIAYDAASLPNALKKIFIQESGQPEITIDPALSTTSTNPVENRVITNTLLDTYLTKLEAKNMIANYSAVENGVLSLNNQNITI